MTLEQAKREAREAFALHQRNVAAGARWDTICASHDAYRAALARVSVEREAAAVRGR